ncbi:MAG: hypothetical protein ACLFUS_16220 [Candidatus Sumerlaeia bacterium]
MQKNALWGMLGALWLALIMLACQNTTPGGTQAAHADNKADKTDSPPKRFVMKASDLDTTGWYPYAGIDITSRRGTALDLSHLLDAPAGKHGWLNVKGEDYVFEDGTVARFWGVNIVASANFPSHDEAERVAELLAQMGVNMTRHHHADADWSEPNFFGNKDNTLELDAEAMDRFDYFIAQLQKRGIYQYFDLLVHRKPMEADGVKAIEDLQQGYKMEGHFAPRLIELQEQFVRQFMNHTNPYTGKRYGNDPCIALLEVINESSLFFRKKEGAAWGFVTDYYQDMWQYRYNRWLREKYGDRETLLEEWKPTDAEAALGKIGLTDEESPQKGTVKSVEQWSAAYYNPYSKARVLDNYRFYYDLEMEYLSRIARVVRETGCKSPITGSNHWTRFPIDLFLNAQFDYIDRHAYWSHPSGGYGYSPGVKFTNQPMVYDRKGGIIHELAERRVRNLPFICTEWQTSAPNTYRQEGMLFMSAYCAFQNWHSTQFAFSHRREMDFNGLLTSNFDVYNQPGWMAAWPMSALIFHRRDVAEASREVFDPMTVEEVFDPATKLRLPAGLALVAKTGLEFTSSIQREPDLQAVVQEHTQGDILASAKGQLRANSSEGWFEVNTPRSQGFTGFGMGNTRKLENVEATIDNVYALVMVSSLEEKPIAESRRLLITTVGNSINTGMKYGENMQTIEAIGEEPVLVEPIHGKIVLHNLKGDLSNAKVHILNASGMRMDEAEYALDGNRMSIPLKAEYQSMHYEIVR